MKILATSRPIPEITDWFSSINSIKLEIRAETSDVTKFIEGRMEELLYVARRNQTLKEEIKAGISEAVDGMFLLANIYLTLLEDKMNVNDIRRQLVIFKSQTKGNGHDQKGKALAHAYEQAMERINSQEEGRRNLAMRALTWVTFAKREITTSELRHALATQDGMSTIDRDDLPDLKDIGLVCVGLITINEKSRIVRLVHYTTHEYFEQTQNRWFPSADAAIFRCCLTYLSFDVFDSGFCQSDSEFIGREISFVLLNYAAHHWGHHISHNAEPREEVIRFLESQAKVEASFQALFVGRPYLLYKEFSQAVKRNMTGLHMAAFFGMIKATKSLLERNHSPNAEDSSNQTPLAWASALGHDAIARLLIDAGAALETKDALYGRTPLMWAVSNGHEAVVKLLLEKGSEVNSRNRAGQTPLTVATFSENKMIMELLLRSGGIIHTDDAFGRTKLITSGVQPMEVLRLFAGFGGQSMVQTPENGRHLPEIGSDVAIQQLIESGVDLNAKDNDHRTQLLRAAENGHRSFIEMLIETVDLNMADSETGMTPLHRAAKRGHISVVKLLVNAGADLEAKDKKDQTPLIVAMQNSQNDVVNFLLRRDASIHTTDGLGQTPLFYAALSENREIVQQLLDRGADANAKNNAGMTPLARAASHKKIDAVRLLIERGADVNAKDNHGMTPIFEAAALGDVDTIRLLVKRSADVNAKNDDGRTPLFTATTYRQFDAVSLLIERGADVNAKDNRGKTPLFYAMRSLTATMQVLLDKGAEINARDENGQSALFSAILYDNQAAVELMTEKGEADVNTPDVTGMSPIAWAEKLGRIEIIHLLLRTATRVNNMMQPGLVNVTVPT